MRCIGLFRLQANQITFSNQIFKTDRPHCICSCVVRRTLVAWLSSIEDPSSHSPNNNPHKSNFCSDANDPRNPSLSGSDKKSYLDLAKIELIIITSSPQPSWPSKSLHPLELPLLSISLLFSHHHLLLQANQQWLMLVLFCTLPHLLLSLIIPLFTHLSISLVTHKSCDGAQCHLLSDSPEGCARMWYPPAYKHWFNTWQLFDANIVYANPQTHLLCSVLPHTVFTLIAGKHKFIQKLSHIHLAMSCLRYGEVARRYQDHRNRGSHKSICITLRHQTFTWERLSP